MESRGRERTIKFFISAKVIVKKTTTKKHWKKQICVIFTQCFTIYIENLIMA